MKNSDLYTICFWLSVVWLFAGGIPNVVSPPKVKAEFVRWGYPSWFGIVVGIFEFLAAAMLLIVKTKLVGWILGLVITLGVIGTLLASRDYKKLPPGVILLLLMIGTYFAVRQ